MSFFRRNVKDLKIELGLDGPYVFYNPDKIEIIHIEKKTEKFILKKKDLFYSQRSNISLKCTIDRPGKDVFSFKLKDKHMVPQSKHEEQEKILVTSDLEGNYYALSSLLKGNGVVDHNLRWIYGKNHLVIIGDMMDRGINVTQCLWLIYKLEQEAELAGGEVHFLLGNHELINMKGITGFVHSKYLELAETIGMDYYQFYSTESELGRWMRTKNTIEIIGDIAFVHAGICPDIVDAELEIDELNQIVRDDIDNKGGDISKREQLVLGNRGLLWYRGFVRDTDDYFILSIEEIDKILNYFNVSKIVIGHTKTDVVTSSYDGKVYRTDVVQPKNMSEGKAKALFIENGIFYKVDNSGGREEFLANY